MELDHPIGLLVQQRDAEGDLQAQAQPEQQQRLPNQLPKRQGELPARLHQRHREAIHRRHGRQGCGAQDVALAVAVALALALTVSPEGEGEGEGLVAATLAVTFPVTFPVTFARALARARAIALALARLVDVRWRLGSACGWESASVTIITLAIKVNPFIWNYN